MSGAAGFGRRSSRTLCTLILMALAAAGCGRAGSGVGEGDAAPESFESLRARMVERVRERGVRDERVLEAMRAVERHLFVPAEIAHLAYEQKPLLIGEDQTISSPYIVGLMTSLVDLDGDESVLEIGTGSGYQAAVLSRLVREVRTIEIRPKLAERARRRLAEQGYANVEVRCGDGYRGWPEHAPYDAIIVTAAPPSVPEELVRELAPGGRMVVPVGGGKGHQMLTLIRKDADGAVSEKSLRYVDFVPMVTKDE